MIGRLLRWGVVAAACVVVAAPGQTSRTPAELWREVEIVRTAHGVPHIRAENLRAGGYALRWLQCEDYGIVTPARLWAARGETAKLTGRAGIEADFNALRARARAIETDHLLEPDVREG